MSFDRCYEEAVRSDDERNAQLLTVGSEESKFERRSCPYGTRVWVITFRGYKSRPHERSVSDV